MLSVFVWWLAAVAIGLVVTPMALWIFRNLPDRGYALARPLGLVVVGYLFWLGGTSGLLHNTRVAIIFVMLLVGLLSAYLVRRKAVDLRQFWAESRRTVIVTEIFFLLALSLFALFRAYNPDITGTEKPMELAFINAILRSDTFPPLDPWLSGFAISYYYFGYLMMAMLTRLTGLASDITFNLSLSLLFAMTVTGAYGLVYNLVALTERSRRKTKDEGRPSTPLLYGLLGSLFIAIIGNLEAIFEVLHCNGLGSDAFWRWLDIKNLITAPASQKWYPTDMWWWWRASRVVHDRNALGQSIEVIDEFPCFSFVLGDCHPHVLALPFVFLALALALNVLAGRHESGKELEASVVPSWLVRMLPEPPLAVLSWALILGSLGFLNTWDLPIHLAVFMLAYAVRRYWQDGRLSWNWLMDVITLGLALLVLGIVLYLPFYIGFRSQAGGIGLVILAKTRLHQYLIMFGLFIWVIAGLGATLVRRRLAASLSAEFWVIGGISIVLAAGFAYLGWWLLVMLTVMLGAGLLLVWWLVGQVARGERAKASSAKATEAWSLSAHPDSVAPLVFALLMALMGLGLTFSVEFIFLKDIFNSRMNTVFKFYYQAWVLLGSASAYGVYWLLSSGQVGRALGSKIARGIWAVGFVVLLAASLAYPALAPYSKAGGFAGEPTLDGTAHLARHRRADYDAIQWLRASVGGAPTILEAPGPQYSEYALVSTHTGFPTMLGWGGHELQWRGNYDEPGKREPVIDTIYRDTNWRQVQTLVEEYGVDYIYVGQLEREKYQLPPRATRKFERFMDLVYDQGGVQIYRCR